MKKVKRIIFFSLITGFMLVNGPLVQAAMTVAPQEIASLFGVGALSSNNLSQTLSVNEEITIEVPVSGSASQVILSKGTIVSPIADFVAPSDLSAALPGLATGVVLDSTLQWGLTNLGMQFSAPITLKIFVGPNFNGRTLAIARFVRSISGGEGQWTSDGIVLPTCAVANGLCVFQATRSSYYVLTASTSDTLPTGQVKSVQRFAEGALIRAIGDPDVYIVKYVGDKQFKRLILSPSVFNSYQHLKWSDILEVDQDTLDSFTTSDLVKAVNDTKVYKLYPAGDTGQKRWVKTMAAFERMGFDWDAIYEINATDRNSYVTGAAIE